MGVEGFKEIIKENSEPNIRLTTRNKTVSLSEHYELSENWEKKKVLQGERDKDRQTLEDNSAKAWEFWGKVISNLEFCI